MKGRKSGALVNFLAILFRKWQFCSFEIQIGGCTISDGGWVLIYDFHIKRI